MGAGSRGIVVAPYVVVQSGAGCCGCHVCRALAIVTDERRLPAPLSHTGDLSCYLAQNFRPEQWGKLAWGVLHGLYFLGCCWILMGLLFVGGVMNLAWVLLITLFVLLEKLLPLRVRLTPISGIAMILAGAGYLVFLV